MRLTITFLLVSVAAAAASSVPVTTCGQVVVRHTKGVLVGDLDCGVAWGFCRASASATAYLDPPIACSSPADCPDPSVQSCYNFGGPDAANGGAAVYVEPGARLDLAGHTIRNVGYGVYGGNRQLVAGRGTIRVTGPGTITGTRQGITGISVITNVTLHDNVYGASSEKLVLKDVDASHNVIGVSAFDKLVATRLRADDNASIGALSYGAASARLRSSHLTGNAGADISTEAPPRLLDTVCEHSPSLAETSTPGIYSPTGPPWGVCSLD